MYAASCRATTGAGSFPRMTGTRITNEPQGMGNDSRTLPRGRNNSPTEAKVFFRCADWSGSVRIRKKRVIARLSSTSDGTKTWLANRKFPGIASLRWTYVKKRLNSSLARIRQVGDRSDLRVAFRLPKGRVHSHPQICHPQWMSWTVFTTGRI